MSISSAHTIVLVSYLEPNSRQLATNSRHEIIHQEEGQATPFSRQTPTSIWTLTSSPLGLNHQNSQYHRLLLYMHVPNSTYLKEKKSKPKQMRTFPNLGKHFNLHHNGVKKHMNPPIFGAVELIQIHLFGLFFFFYIIFIIEFHHCSSNTYIHAHTNFVRHLGSFQLLS